MDRFELTVDEILEATRGKFICGPLCSFSGVSTDTRTMGVHQLFIHANGKKLQWT